MSATIEDVARRAGVSIRTVSRVINDRPDVAETTRTRVLQAIAELNYRPNSLAQSMVTGSTKTIGVVLPDISNPFFGRAIRGCEDILANAGYNIFLCNTDEDLEKERKYLTLLVDRQVDGVILWGSRADCETLESVLGPELPTVTVDCHAYCGNAVRVDVENHKGAQTVIDHLISLGHRQIGHLAGPAERLTAQRRLAGYREALERAGLEFSPLLVLEAAPSVYHGYQAAIELFQRADQPTAIFAYNDLMAIGAILACQQVGLNVPKDVAIVGFDDVVTASLVSPPLTTVRIDQYRLGALSGQLLLERMRETGASVAAAVDFPTELIIRNSCGARRRSQAQTRKIVEELIAAVSVDMSVEDKRSAGVGRSGLRYLGGA
jgi:LacI family transcriptional regulator